MSLVNIETYPLVTVGIASYNHKEYVAEAIQSVIDQDYKNIELIIIDDGSSDTSVRIIESLVEDCRKRFSRFEFRSRENKGFCSTLNEMVLWGKGEYFSVLASDDIFVKNKLETQVKYLSSHCHLMACCGGIQEIGPSGRKGLRRVLLTTKNYSFDDIMAFKYFLPAPTLMCRLSFLLSRGGYPSNHLLEDFYIFLKMTSEGNEIACLNQVLTLYRRHDTNSSRLKFREHAKDRALILKNYEGRKIHSMALSFSGIIEATQVLGYGKMSSFPILFRSLSIYPCNFFSLRMCRYFLYFFTPKRFIRKRLRI